MIHTNLSSVMRPRGPWVGSCAIGCFTIEMTNDFVGQIVAHNLDQLNNGRSGFIDFPRINCLNFIPSPADCVK